MQHGLSKAEEPREWLLKGGGGFEGGEDGLRATTVSGEGLIDYLESYREYLSEVDHRVLGSGEKQEDSATRATRTPRPDGSQPEQAALLSTFQVVMDCVDYTAHNCSTIQLIGAVLPVDVIQQAREAIRVVESVAGKLRVDDVLQTKGESSAKPETLSPQTNVEAGESGHAMRPNGGKDFNWWYDRVRELELQIERLDPRSNPPKGFRYCCIVTNYKGTWFNGIGKALETSGCILIERVLAKDGSCDLFVPISPRSQDTPGSGTKSVAASTDDGRPKKEVVPHNCLQEKEKPDLGNETPIPLEQPREESSGRFCCSLAHPMPPDRPKGERWAHSMAREIADYGDTRRMECSTCGYSWTEELPQ